MKDERGNNIGDSRYTTTYNEDLKMEVEDLPEGTTNEFIVDLTQKLRADPAIVRNIRNGKINYYNHFYGTEAVDWMLQNRIARDRRQAVAYGRAAIRAAEVVHCTRGHDFKDEELLYRFVTEREKRLINPQSPLDYVQLLLVNPPIIFSVIAVVLAILNIPYILPK